MDMHEIVRKQIKRRRREALIKGVAFTALGSVVTLAIATQVITSKYSRGAAAQQQTINELNAKIISLQNDNFLLDRALTEAEYKIKILINNHEVYGPEPTYYDVPLSKDIQRYIWNECVDYGIANQYELVLALIWQESCFDEDAVSESGDHGLMQINEVNHGWLSDLLGVDNFHDAKQNIAAGVYLLSDLLGRYDEEHKALMAYNMGESGAATVWETGKTNSTYSREIIAKRDMLLCGTYKAELGLD